MGRSTVNFVLVQRVFNLVREDACGQTRDQLLGLVGIRGMQNIVVDQDIFSKEGQLQIHGSATNIIRLYWSHLIFHVLEQTTD